MKKISYKSLPTKLLIYSTGFWIMALDYYHAPQWLHIVMGVLGVIAWLACFVSLYHKKHIDIFEE